MADKKKKPKNRNKKSPIILFKVGDLELKV